MGSCLRLAKSHFVTCVASLLCSIILGQLVSACAGDAAKDAPAMTYFLSPSGVDSNAGTSTSSPWRTFNFAVPQLRPGDKLILMDGAYTNAVNGDLRIAGMNGSSSQPITIQAQNQRQAHLDGDGLTDTMRIDNSSYLVFDGLQVSSQDNASATSASEPVVARTSHHLIFRNMLVHHNNRYQNSHLIELQSVTDSLIEDTELYYHHRHGILVFQSNSNTFRRLYCNSRGYGTIPGGFPNGHGVTGGDVCVSIYPGSNNLLENVISDGPQVSFDIQAIEPSSGNRFLGVIGIGSWYGGVIKARGNTSAEQPVNNVIKDMVVINAERVGIYARGAKGTRCDQCTIIGSGNSGLLADVEPGASGDGTASFYATNTLSLNNKDYGIGISDQTDWLVEYPNSFNNGGLQYSPATSANLVNKTGLDPQLGSCRVYLPDGSPLKGAGKNGADIGANVLYRYQDGLLTNIPLWDRTTGKFPCGAVVAGINNVSGSSCFDVHERLNVNSNGCSLPASYRN